MDIGEEQDEDQDRRKPFAAEFPRDDSTPLEGATKPVVLVAKARMAVAAVVTGATILLQEESRAKGVITLGSAVFLFLPSPRSMFVVVQSIGL